MRKLALIAILPILLVATLFVHNAMAEMNTQLTSQRAETSQTKAQLETTAQEKQKIADQKKTLETQLKAEADKSAQLQKENADLKAKKQARLAAAKLVAVTKSQPRTVAVNGSCAEWLAAAGVTDLTNAMILIGRESGCNPNAVNKSSGACGVGQELPCGKSGCSLGDGACQVRWMNGYVLGRYGSWANAVAHSTSVGWY